jgi:hypothetical protein
VNKLPALLLPKQAIKKKAVKNQVEHNVQSVAKSSRLCRLVMPPVKK